MPVWILQLFTMAPTVFNEGMAIVKAFQAIMASDAAKTAEQAGKDLINHMTPGKPNSPALGPDAPPPAT